MAKRDASSEDSGCAVCKNQHAFQLPAEVLDAIRHGRLVVFAGAGISTESPTVMPYTFYDEIAMELGKRPKATKATFPELMSQYCRQPNGRRRLLQKLKGRMDYINAFPTVQGAATRFHDELSTIPHLDDIVTTNWDTYFEDHCGATPIVAAQDFVFWSMPGRKVFKIHGSVSSYSSIIATNEDYRKCYSQLTKGVVGSNLKMLLATKVVVFVGYSFRDHDFVRVYRFLRREMKEMLPRAYAITVSPESAQHFAELGLTSIVTDGTYFFETLKKHLAAEGRMVPDSRFVGVWAAWLKIRAAHNALHASFSVKKNPELVYCASYQDGLMDAFGRAMKRKQTGEYSCPDHVAAMVVRYNGIQREKRAQKRYSDVAYIEGYMNGLLYLTANDKQRSWFPKYYVFGYKGDIRSMRQYRAVCRNAKHLHRAAYLHATKLAKNAADGIEFHHTAFLL